VGDFSESPSEADTFYTVVILHCDDFRFGGTPEILQVLFQQLFGEYKITIADGYRFLGMDVSYEVPAGILVFSMQTYIATTLGRFATYGCSAGVPFRQLVGSPLWVVLCVHGPHLLRVKELAQKSNSFMEADYAQALCVLHRIAKVRDV
jgi:hypothetical protein